ncbi:hypothetical protein ON010_g6354 [Phytophthora cinnamomi]|nr:hypothetical protein ON010_g6354 [Phytophthora cinnamomi]
MIARQRSAERERVAGQRRMNDVRLAERRRVADDAMKKLNERKQQRVHGETEGRVRQQAKPARVSLVQHRGEQIERRDDGGVGREETREVRQRSEKRNSLHYGGADSNGARVAAVRMVRGTEIDACVVTPVEVAVAANDGEVGVFLPTKYTCAVMLAATIRNVKNGKAIVPAVNAKNAQARLPASDEPLEDARNVNVGTKDDESRKLVVRLLCVYRQLMADTCDCPPATVLSTENHIDTGDAAPIMLKRRRQAQAEDSVIESNVRKMLAAGVIEEGDGAWGFPVAMVRKKYGEVGFFVDYRELNKITTKDVYPLPRIDETLEAHRGALLFTTLDLKAGYWQIRV